MHDFHLIVPVVKIEFCLRHGYAWCIVNFLY